MSALCARPSCRRPFDPDHLESNACKFHPGAPLFHEGSKSWTCCSSTKVLTFDDFMAITPCATGTHTLETPATIAPAQSATVGNAAAAVAKAEASAQAAAPSPPPPARTPALVVPPRPERSATATPEPVALVDDSPDAVPLPGSSCKRASCRETYATGMERGDDECIHHPGSPIFHEGSKGWSCCKRRVLDFSDFLGIAGCSRGRHIFVGGAAPASAAMTAALRTDHYQTPATVIASVFLKQVDSGRSRVDFTHWSISYELVTTTDARSANVIDLYGPIDPDKSTYRVLGTKVEITLVKADGRSWPQLEASEDGKSTRGAQISFGVNGRGGTVGAKEASFGALAS